MGEKRTIESAEERKRLPDSGRQLKQETRLREKAEEKLTDCFRFQRLLFDISTDSLRVSHDRIDSEIENALKRMLEFFQVDRCVMVKILRDGTSWQIAYAAFRDGLRDLPRHVDLPIDMYPWHFNRITECHEVSCYSSLDEMPAEAGIDRKNYEEWGIRSIVNVPIAVDGSLEYVMCISSDSRERVWPENYIPRMRMLGEIIVKSMQLSRARLRLEKRQQFEKLIADISAGFVTVAPDDFENAINECIRKICGFFKADRCSLRLLSKDETRLGRFFEYSRKGIEPAPDYMLKKALPWYMDHVVRGKTMAIESLDEFPNEAQNERAFCQASGIKSVLSVPMVSEGKVMGACSLVSVREQRAWPGDLVQRLRFASDLFAGALSRKHMDEQLRERLLEIEQLKTQLEQENIHLRKEIELRHLHKEIVGRSHAMKDLLAKVEQVARTDATVLIEGETGSGKELMAQAVHRLSTRKDRPLVTVNCASLPPTLIESELFGREKGAYTGAMTRMTGRFEAADGATLFLDEIGEMPQEVQAKLLRVLEEGKFERLGSTKTLKVDVRIIAATNRNLAQEVNDGKFRKDLFYRLNVFPLAIPPLRERPEDIPLLVWFFVRQYEEKMGKRFERISKKDMEDLIRYQWPGNVRELRNVVEHSMILSGGKTLEIRPPKKAFSDIFRNMTLEDVEREHISGTLRKTGWRISGKASATEILGIKRTTLYSKMKKLGIRRPKP